MYNPLVGGVPPVEPAGAEEDRALQEKAQKAATLERRRAAKQQQNNVPNETGRPTGATASFNRADIQNTVYDIEKRSKNSQTSSLALMSIFPNAPGQ